MRWISISWTLQSLVRIVGMNPLINGQIPNSYCILCVKYTIRMIFIWSLFRFDWNTFNFKWINGKNLHLSRIRNDNEHCLRNRILIILHRISTKIEGTSKLHIYYLKCSFSHLCISFIFNSWSIYSWLINANETDKLHKYYINICPSI